MTKKEIKQGENIKNINVDVNTGILTFTLSFLKEKTDVSYSFLDKNNMEHSVIFQMTKPEKVKYSSLDFYKRKLCIWEGKSDSTISLAIEPVELEETYKHMCDCVARIPCLDRLYKYSAYNVSIDLNSKRIISTEFVGVMD